MKNRGVFILSLTLLASSLLYSCTDSVEEALKSNFGILIQGASDLYLGKSLQLSAKNSTLDDSLVWSSSDESVASVSDTGLVKGLKEGSVTIKCSSKKHSYSFDEVILKVIDGSKINYKVTFKNYDGSVLEETTVHGGEIATYLGETPTRPSSDVKNYTFLGWDKDLNESINEDTTFVAQYGESNIDFNSYAFYLLTGPEEFAGKYLAYYKGNEEEVNLPTSYNYRDVIGIYDGSFSNNTTVKTINIPESYVYIGAKAFYGCANLTHINLPPKLVVLGEAAFYNCTSLLTVKIPETITTITQQCFSNCPNLVSVNISDKVTSIQDYAFSNCPNLVIKSLPSSLKTIGDSAFYKCNKFSGNIEFPNDLDSVGPFAFSQTSITGITINAKLTNFSSSAALGARSLTTIKVNEENANYKAIDDVLYDKNGTTLFLIAPNNTREVNIAEGVTTIKSYSSSFSKATKVTFPKSLSLIESNGLGTSYIKEFVFNEEMDGSKLVMEEYAFSDCYELTSFSVPDGVIKLPRYFLYGSSKLVTLNIPDSVLSIGECAFSDTAITEFKIPENFKTIPERLLDGTNVKEIVIPKNVESIETYAFSDLKELTKVTFTNSKGITYMDYGVFNGCSKLSEIVGDFPLIDVKSSIDLVEFPFGTLEGTAIENFKLPDGYQEISNFAFKDCTKLKDIYLPASLHRVDKWVFENTALEHIYFGGTKEEFAKVLTKLDTDDEESLYGTVYDDDEDVLEEKKSYNILNKLYAEDKVTYNSKYSEVDFSKTSTTK